MHGGEAQNGVQGVVKSHIFCSPKIFPVLPSNSTAIEQVSDPVYLFGVSSCCSRPHEGYGCLVFMLNSFSQQTALDIAVLSASWGSPAILKHEKNARM